MENVDFPEYFAQNLLDTVAREYFIYTGRFVSFYYMFLRLWVLTVIDRLDFFFLRNRQNGGAKIKRIDKIGQEIELA